jgi:hypothetical protein
MSGASAAGLHLSVPKSVAWPGTDSDESPNQQRISDARIAVVSLIRGLGLVDPAASVRRFAEARHIVEDGETCVKTSLA